MNRQDPVMILAKIKSSTRRSNFMAVGRKSKVDYMSIPNHNDPSKPHKVRIQMNKNGGICDINAGVVKTSERVIELKRFDGKKTKKTVKESTFVERQRMSELVSEFQGRQLYTQDVQDALFRALTIYLN